MPPKARNRTGECRIKSGSAFFETGDFENQSGGMANADGTALESPPPTTIDEKLQHKCIILDCFDKDSYCKSFCHPSSKPMPSMEYLLLWSTKSGGVQQ